MSNFSFYFFWDILCLTSINRHNPSKALATISSEAAKNWPSYLPVEIVTQKRTLRSNNSEPCVDHGEKHTFQDQAKNAFNKLSINIRSDESKIIFFRQARNFYKDKALARAF